jgi:aryl-alcohol dehydrogenase
VLVGVSPPGTEVVFSIDSLFFGQTVGGAIEGDCIPKIFIPQLIALWQQGRFPFDRLVTFYDFDQINTAVEDSLSGKVLKPVLRIGNY